VLRHNICKTNMSGMMLNEGINTRKYQM